MQMKYQKMSDSGFTLIEVVVVITLIAITAAIATPRFIAWKQNSDLNADMRRLYAFFQKARLEAVTQNTNSLITFGQLDENGDTWDFFSFVDTNGNDEYDPDDPTEPERVLLAVNRTTGVTMTSNNFNLNADGLETATFNSRGLLGEGGGGTFLGATITMQSSVGVSHDLIFNRHGKMRIE